MSHARIRIVQPNHPNIRAQFMVLIHQQMDSGLAIELPLVLHGMPILPVSAHEPDAQRRMQLPVHRHAGLIISEWVRESVSGDQNYVGLFAGQRREHFTFGPSQPARVQVRQLGDFQRSGYVGLNLVASDLNIIRFDPERVDPSANTASNTTVAIQCRRRHGACCCGNWLPSFIRVALLAATPGRSRVLHYTGVLASREIRDFLPVHHIIVRTRSWTHPQRRCGRKSWRRWLPSALRSCWCRSKSSSASAREVWAFFPKPCTPVSTSSPQLSPIFPCAFPTSPPTRTTPTATRNSRVSPRSSKRRCSFSRRSTLFGRRCGASCSASRYCTPATSPWAC